MQLVRRTLGFTLVEMMVTVAVAVILIMIAVPSFTDFRQRSAIRGAGEQALSLWNQARFEAAKRNSLVKFGVVESAGSFCLGVATTTSATDSTPCDCLTANACDIATFPAVGDQGEWRRVTLASAPTLGQTTGVVVLDSKIVKLTENADEGAITLAGPSGAKAYLLNLRIDRFGRGYLCESTAAVDKLTEYSARQCAP
jgi:prepilin-type N-terminal cleavage/methylation domain-containing protein